MRAPVVGHVTRSGLRVAYLDWGGKGPPLVMLHPNGFCGGFFDPLARRLTDGFRPVAVDLRGHGRSDTPSELEDLHFSLLAGDVAAVLAQLGLREVSLIGVSMGGGVGIHLAELLGSEMTGLMLCEAIAFPSVQTASANGNHLADLARKRRKLWPSRTAMIESYGSRPPFGALAPEWLAAYVEWGTRDCEDGMVELACEPETEARCFEIGGTTESSGQAFELLATLGCPISVLAGAETDLGIERFEAQADKAGVPLQVLDGGHFFLHEDTDRAEALVRLNLRQSMGL